MKRQRFHIYLDEESNDNLNKQAKKYQKTRSNFIRDLINKRSGLKTLKNIERIQTLNTKVALDLSRVTGNLNQIAYQLNKQEFQFDEFKFYELIEELIHLTKNVQLQIKTNNAQLKSTI